MQQELTDKLKQVQLDVQRPAAKRKDITKKVIRRPSAWENKEAEPEEDVEGEKADLEDVPKTDKNVYA